MKKYKVKVEIMSIVYENHDYDILAKDEDELGDKVYALVDHEGVEWEDYVTTIISEEEV